MRKVHRIFFFLFSCIWLPACGQKTFDEKMESLYRYTVPVIQAENLKDLLAKEKVYVLDTRTPEEFGISHIAGARLIDFDNFKISMVQEIPKDAEVVVYCSVGYRSERIGEALQAAGYQHVSNLYGGIFNWKNKGNTIYNKNNLPTDSVHTYNRNWSQWLYNGIKVYE
ncbi:rhodanese-like domain-containing protein [Marinoscillum sp.]|uniref:rhodanese-like domain-containing protein n=1 Tax=Marinoscillum sp. TaxID=2024838 RepID=UPI003BA9E395